MMMKKSSVIIATHCHHKCSNKIIFKGCDLVPKRIVLFYVFRLWTHTQQQHYKMEYNGYLNSLIYVNAQDVTEIELCLF